MDGLPSREDAVAAWLKKYRDRYEEIWDREWYLLDHMLDEYREHADTGTELDEEVHYW